MIYVRSKMNPPPKSGPICGIEEYGLFHVITAGERIENRSILLRIHQNIMKYHDFSTQSVVDHRPINLF